METGLVGASVSCDATDPAAAAAAAAPPGDDRAKWCPAARGAGGILYSASAKSAALFNTISYAKQGRIKTSPAFKTNRPPAAKIFKVLRY